jgi:serine/threonine-protein phosphatase 2A activator
MDTASGQTAASSQPTSSPNLQTLKKIDPSSSHSFQKPSKCIHEGPDVSRFLTSLAYRDIGIFLLQLNHAVVPRNKPGTPVPQIWNIPSKMPETPSIQALQVLLGKIDALIAEAPPDPGPRRFGNVSFRKWYGMLEEQLSMFLGEGKIGDTLKAAGGDAATEEVGSYLLGAFGSSQRLDYGTGHELSFLAFLGCLWKLGYFQDGRQGGDIEREIVLYVFERYVNPTQVPVRSLTDIS